MRNAHLFEPSDHILIRLAQFSRSYVHQPYQSIKFFAGDACRYPVVREAALRLGWKLIDDASSEKAKRSCNVLWIDTSNVLNYFNSIQPWQRINHFPGMINIARKTRLAENLEMMKKEFEEEYDFFPTTFIIPRDLSAIKGSFTSSGRSKCTFIVKPDGGCQGKGIFLTKSLEAIEDIKTTHVAQRYIPNPLLIDGKKFDLRIYVLITSCDPLRIYLFRDGLVRLCTEDFVKPSSSNMDDRTMHLTNFSINKKSEQFEGSNDDSGESGSKRSIKWFLSWLSDTRNPQSADALWRNIGEICVKTILSIAPTLLREYKSTFGLNTCAGSESSNDGDRDNDIVCDSNNDDPMSAACQSKKESRNDLVAGSRCFAILGVDVMVDSDINPHLIEVNHLPSFATGSPLDEAIKSKVCYQALSALKCKSSDQHNHELTERKRRVQRLRGLRSNAPVHPPDQYDCNEKNESIVRAESQRNIEELVTDIYAKHAPDKVDKVDALLKKYRGYEDWLIRRLEEKYQSSESSTDSVEASQEDACDGDSISSSESHDTSSNNDLEDMELLEEHKVLVEQGDYDRIYPPVDKRENKFDVYQQMLKHASDHDAKEQKRLTCPLWLQRRHSREDNTDAMPSSRNDKDYATPSRGDWMFHGNVHIQKRDIPIKVIQPPSQKQIEAAERLSKGYSVEDRNHAGSSIHEGHVNNSFINRLTKAEKVGRKCRKRNEGKYMPKARLQMTPINLELNRDESSNDAFGYKLERYYVDFAGRKIG